MFESTLEAQALHTGERRFRTVSAVALLYLTAVSFLAIVAAFTVRPINPPDVQPIFYVIQPPPEPPPGPLLPVVAPAPTTGGRHEAPRPIVPAPVPPVTTPDRLPDPVPSAPIAGPDGPTTGEGNGNGFDQGGGGGVDKGGGGGGGHGTDSGDVGPVALSGEMIPPVRVVKVDPVYPNAARIARMSGKVVVQAIIGLDGRVESTEILASTSPLFDASAMEAVRQWRYTPATMNGRPVRVYFSVRVEFVLR